MEENNFFISDLTGKEYPLADKVSAKSIRNSIFSFINIEYPQLTKNDFISISELNQFRKKYISESVSNQIKHVSNLEKKVLDTLAEQTTLSDKVEEDKPLTIGQKVADKVAHFGGSWTFISLFGLFLFIWICVNIFILINKPFDPYPFILLNLILSCLAAIQAPVIMMSQNRREDKDRERSKKDYMVNLKSEIEIRTLHEKIDHLIIHQQQDLMEIQDIQIEMLNEILDGKKR